MTNVPPATRPISAVELATLERRLGALLPTGNDVVLIQGEATIALEAVAHSLARPGLRALNLVTGPYGAVFGRWLARGGAEVVDVASPFDAAIAPEVVAAELSAGRFDVLSVVHAEAATGAVNPLREIAALARDAGVVTVVDAVASVGAEPLRIDEWGLNLVVLGAQKALGGPSGVSAVVLDADAWALLADRPDPPRDSVLSLLDWRANWIDAGRAVLPVIPNHLELRGLAATLDERGAEGLDATIARHAQARDATRAGLRALGLEPWVRDDAHAAGVATLVAPRQGVSSAQLLEASVDGAESTILSLAPGGLADRALRISHTGADATPGAVAAALAALERGLAALGHPLA